MSTNKDLLKQAIAEAKTIREAAIANAKEALEESLTPHLKEMLAQKLQEMDNEDEDEFDPGHDIEQAQHNIERGLYEAEEAEEEEEEKAEEEEDIEIEDMSVEDLKDLIRDIVAQETGAGGEESGEELPADDLGAGDMTGVEDEEEIDINELLAELAEMDGEKVEEGLEDWIDKISAFLQKAGKNSPIVQSIEKAVSKYETEKHSGANRLSEGNVEEGLEDWIDKISAKLQKAGRNSPIVQSIEKAVSKYETEKHSGAHKISEENMEEGLEDWIDKISAFLDKAGRNSPIVQSIEKAVSKYETEKHSGAHKISEEESEELAEALQTVAQLRTQLQEVNLLNAKLLYVNKVFKANNLTEGQKVNVVAAFDKAETVKEVKLVFETVSKNVVAKQPVRQAVKEHKSFASKPAGSTQKQVINEVSEAVNRMQILAGIKERQF
jgi:hypothetical protein